MSTDHMYPASDGVLDQRAGQSVIRFERHLAHPIERVWAALTEPDQLIGWWGEAELDLVEGGRFVMRWLNTDNTGDRFTMHATSTRFKPPYLLETDGDAHGVLRWELRPDGSEATILSFSSTLDLPEEFRAQALAGWHYHLDALAAKLDGHSLELADLPHDRWDQIHARYTTQLG